MEIYPLLKMPPFQGTTEDELLPLILAPEHACRLYKPSDFIAMQGEVYRSLFILCSGKVRTQMVNAEGKQLTIETLKAPQLLAPAFVFSSENRLPVNYLRMHGSILNQQEVAQILGVARPSLARALSELAGEGYIRMEGKEIQIIKTK